MNSRTIAACSLAVGVLASNVYAQQQGGFNPAALARDALAEPFVGLTSTGERRTDLFELSETGVSTAPVVKAASNLLEARLDALSVY